MQWRPSSHSSGLKHRRFARRSCTIHVRFLKRTMNVCSVRLVFVLFGRFVTSSTIATNNPTTISDGFEESGEVQAEIENLLAPEKVLSNSLSTDWQSLRSFQYFLSKFMTHSGFFKITFCPMSLFCAISWAALFNYMTRRLDSLLRKQNSLPNPRANYRNRGNLK